MIDMMKLMNPQWARWFDQTAEAQGQDSSQPYDLNFAGEFGRPSLEAMQPSVQESGEEHGFYKPVTSLAPFQPAQWAGRKSSQVRPQKRNV